MSYSIIFLRQASRSIHKMQAAQVKRISQYIDRLADDPRPRGCKKIESQKDRFRIRIGDFRVLYSVDDDKKEVIIHHIVHRKDAY